MFLQNKDDVFSIEYKKGITYRGLFGKSEEQFSDYNFHYAPVESLLKNFEENEKMVDILLEKNLYYPAYEYVLKNSHNFNLLDARGYVSQQQRPDFIARIRNTARKVALNFLQNENN